MNCPYRWTVFVVAAKHGKPPWPGWNWALDSVWGTPSTASVRLRRGTLVVPVRRRRNGWSNVDKRT